MTAFYNEIDPYAAQWLRNLITAGHIAFGVVDERSIEDIEPAELDGYTQCHFFAGIGVWSLALRNAGWPAFHHLIEQCRPATVIGEQVASKDAEPWLDLVQADLEALDYAFGAVPFPSASVGAPHIRDRLYWVADTSGDGHIQRVLRNEDGAECASHSGGQDQRGGEPSLTGSSESGKLADTTSDRWGWRGAGGSAEEGRQPRSERTGQLSDGLEGHGAFVGLDDTNYTRLERLRSGHQAQKEWDIAGRSIGTASGDGGLDNSISNGRAARGNHDAQHDGQQSDATRNLDIPSPINGFWEVADWLFCRDGKWRPVEPGTFPLAHGAASRVGRLRAYGNAINAQAAQVFIECYMESQSC